MNADEAIALMNEAQWTGNSSDTFFADHLMILSTDDPTIMEHGPEIMAALGIDQLERGQGWFYSYLLKTNHKTVIDKACFDADVDPQSLVGDGVLLDETEPAKVTFAIRGVALIARLVDEGLDLTKIQTPDTKIVSHDR